MGFWDLGRRSRNYDSLDSLNQLDVSTEVQTAGIRNYVIAAPLTKKSDCLRVSHELDKGNILILDTKDFPNASAELDSILFELKNTLEQKGGEMARISNNRILVVPGHFKIVKKNL